MSYENGKADVNITKQESIKYHYFINFLLSDGITHYSWCTHVTVGSKKSSSSLVQYHVHRAEKVFFHCFNIAVSC
jgi:hypothetical protein